MKNFTKLLILTLILTLAFAECKKDEVTKSGKELLTSKSWRFSSSKTNGVADVISDCEKDDYILFKTDGTYTWTTTTVKCAANETGDTGTWVLSADEKTMTVDGTEVATILELTETRFVISSTQAGVVHEQSYIAF